MQKCDTVWSIFPEMFWNFLKQCTFLFFCAGQNITNFLKSGNFLKSHISDNSLLGSDMIKLTWRTNQCHTNRNANINIQKIGRIQTKKRRFSKLHATSMAQSLPEIRRLPNLGVKMDKNVYRNREGWHLCTSYQLARNRDWGCQIWVSKWTKMFTETGRVGISVQATNLPEIGIEVAKFGCQNGQKCLQKQGGLASLHKLSTCQK